MASRLYELSDFEWLIIAPLLPNEVRGTKRATSQRDAKVFVATRRNLPCRRANRT
jgi:transposase